MENKLIAVQQKAGSITFDIEGIKKELTRKQKEYMEMYFTEENKGDAKKVVADLRKEKKAVSDNIKEAIEAYMRPCMLLKEQADEIYRIYDETISHISQKLTAFEEERVKAKKKLIQALYEEMIGDMSGFLPLQRIYNPKWENATANRRSICEEMMQTKEAAKAAIHTIKEMDSDVEAEALELYQKTFDLSQAVTFLSKHERMKAEIVAREQERIRREEEGRIRREEREKLEAERRAQEEKRALIQKAEEERMLLLRKAEEEKQTAIEQAAQEAVDSLIPEMEGGSDLYEYRISLNVDAKDKLERYMDSVGIEWELM